MYDDSAPFKRVPFARALFSFVIVCAATMVLYATYLEIAHVTADFKLRQLDRWLFLPDSLIPYVAGASPTSTLAAVLITSVHWCIYSLIAIFVTYQARSWYYRRKVRAMELERPQLDGNAGTRHKLPAHAIPEKDLRIQPTLITDKGVLHDLYPRYNLCMKRTPLKLKSEAVTPVQKIQKELLEVLLAHPFWSADPDGHHADVDLDKHSVEVAKRMAELAPEDPLAMSIGLSHDIGKLLAYKKKETKSGESYWVRRTQNHDILSSQIIRSMDSFKLLSEDDRATLNLVVTYAHNPERLPQKSATKRVRHLLALLRQADGLATAKDKQRPAQNIDDGNMMAEVLREIPKVIEGLNINQSLNSNAHADGWMLVVSDVIAIKEDRLRDGLARLLSPKTINALAITANKDKGKPHPSAPAISKALESLNLVMHKYNDRASRYGLYSVTAGSYRFRDCWVLSRNEVKTLVGKNTYENWGNCPYKLLIKDY